MLIFDLVHVVRAYTVEIGVVLWYEEYPDTIIEVLPGKYILSSNKILVKDCILDLCYDLTEMFPHEFPSFDNIRRELLTVHSLNKIKKGNTLGNHYPIFSDVGDIESVVGKNILAGANYENL